MIDPSKSIPTASSESQSWIQWHKTLRKVFGKKKANEIWVYAWSKRGGANAKGNTVSTRSYMEKQGVELDKTSLSALADFGSSVGGFFGGVFSIWKWSMIIGTGIVGVILVRVLWKMSKDPNKSLGQIASVTPQGRAIKGASAVSKMKKVGGTVPKPKI